MEQQVVPRELKQLVAKAVPPGVRIQRAGGTPTDPSWWFELIWAGQTFELTVPKEEWADGQHELIALRGRFAAPAPEATRGGHGLWIRWCDRHVVKETFSYEFQLYRQPAESPRIGWVRIAVPSAVTFAAQARELDHEPHAYLLATVLWALKHRIDEGVQTPDGSIRLAIGPETPAIEAATPEVVRVYAAFKLRQAYRIAGQSTTLEFDWTDLEYLGVSRDEFVKTVLARDRRDWIVSGLTLSPTDEFVRHCEAFQS